MSSSGLKWRGLALGGSVAINLAAAFLLATAILQPSATRRGRLLTWLMAAGGFLLSLIEIARAA